MSMCHLRNWKLPPYAHVCVEVNTLGVIPWTISGSSNTYSELHLCFSGVETKQPAGLHRDRKRVALGQEDKQISLVGSPISLS